jgi:hypothetical protein
MLSWWLVLYYVKFLSPIWLMIVFVILYSYLGIIKPNSIYKKLLFVVLAAVNLYVSLLLDDLIVPIYNEVRHRGRYHFFGVQGLIQDLCLTLLVGWLGYYLVFRITKLELQPKWHKYSTFLIYYIVNFSIFRFL